MRLISVTEPPSSVVILDGFLQQLSVVAGPLEEGNDLILTCKAYGGNTSKNIKHTHPPTSPRRRTFSSFFSNLVCVVFISFDRLSATVGDVVARRPVIGQHDRRSLPRVSQQFVSGSQSWEVK